MRRNAGIVPYRTLCNRKTLSMDYFDPDSNQVRAYTILSASAMSMSLLNLVRLSIADGKAKEVDPEQLKDVIESEEDSSDPATGRSLKRESSSERW